MNSRENYVIILISVPIYDSNDSTKGLSSPRVLEQ